MASPIRASLPPTPYVPTWRPPGREACSFVLVANDAPVARSLSLNLSPSSDLAAPNIPPTPSSTDCSCESQLIFAMLRCPRLRRATRFRPAQSRSVTREDPTHLRRPTVWLVSRSSSPSYPPIPLHSQHSRRLRNTHSTPLPVLLRSAFSHRYSLQSCSSETRTILASAEANEHGCLPLEFCQRRLYSVGPYFRQSATKLLGLHFECMYAPNRSLRLLSVIAAFQ
jgi:hypothetical protein